MVAPHLTTQLTRSLVRVPNSGAEKPHEVHLLDLSRVSPAAAMVQALHGLPANLFTPRSHMQIRSTPLSMDSGLVKPSAGSISPSEPPPTVGNGLVQQRTAAYVSSGPTSADTATSLVELGSRTGSRTGTFPFLNAPNDYVTQSSNPATLSPAGRKRPLPLLRQDAGGTAIATTTAGDMRSPKVPRTAAGTPGQPPRKAPLRRRATSRATKDQLLRQIEQLRAENESLRSRSEFFRNYCLSMQNQQRVATNGGPSGLLVH